MASKKKKTQGVKQSRWKVTAERFVGFIDIMGFKDMVGRNSHEAIYKMMRNVSNAMSINQDVFAFDYENEGENMNLIMMTYSDSIMIYSRNSDKNCLESFIAAVGGLSEDLFEDEIPHRGAIAFGTMTLDFERSIFFGQPLIDAYLLSEELNFYGIVVHSSAEFRRGFRSDEQVIEYDCPFKNGNGKHLTILPSIFMDEYEKKFYLDFFKAIKKLRIKTSGALRKYIDNTIAYFDYAYLEWQKRVARREARGRITNDTTLPF